MSSNAMARPTRRRAVTLDQAKALVSIAQSGSFERAATELGLKSATSVFHLVGRMEVTLGHGSLVGPSAHGKAVLTALGREVLPLAEALVEAYGAFEADKHEVRFSSYPSIAARVASTIATFNDRHAQISAAFYEITDQSRRDRGETLVSRVATGEVDLAVAPSQFKNPRLAKKRLYSWTLRLVLPQGDRRRSRTTLTIDELTDLSFLVSPVGHSSRRLFDEASRGANTRPRIAMELGDQYVLEKIARAGRHYAAVIPDDAFGEPDTSLGPALVSADRRHLGGSYSLYYAKTQTSAARAGSMRSGAVLELTAEVVEALASSS
jgi:DNA-binding transcriptional LysR family regulator